MYSNKFNNESVFNSNANNKMEYSIFDKKIHILPKEEKKQCCANKTQNRTYLKGKGLIGDVISQGSYGIIYKYGDKHVLKRNKGFAECGIAAIKEIVAMKVLNHPNIMKIQTLDRSSVRLPPNVFEGGPEDDILIVMERSTKGDMDKSFITGNERYLFQLISAVDYMHDSGVVHLDLKGLNILLFPDGIRVTDFGTCQFIKNRRQLLSSFDSGTRLYQAPEVLKREKFSYKADTWSIGCVFFRMLFGGYVFKYTRDSESYQNLVRDFINVDKRIIHRALIEKYGDTPGSIYFDLLVKLLQEDPSRRIELKDALKHQLFARYKDIPATIYMRKTSKKLDVRDKSVLALYEVAKSGNLQALWMASNLYQECVGRGLFKELPKAHLFLTCLYVIEKLGIEDITQVRPFRNYLPRVSCSSMVEIELILVNVLDYDLLLN